MIENLSARMEVARNRPQQAEQQYLTALARYPESRALIYGYAEHFIAIRKPDNAVKLILSKQGLYPEDAHLYDLLAKAYSLQNKSLLSHQALSEAYYRKYDLRRAIEQMDLALSNDGDFISSLL